MIVKDWIKYEDAKNFTDNKIGGFGGFFNDGMRWEDYIETFTDKAKIYVEALRYEIVNKNLKFTGRDHQSSNHENAPLFEDDTTATYSMRAWGDLMAAIWSQQEDKDYCYMDFYM